MCSEQVTVSENFNNKQQQQQKNSEKVVCVTASQFKLDKKKKKGGQLPLVAFFVFFALAGNVTAGMSAFYLKNKNCKLKTDTDIQNTQEIKRTLFNTTEQDKTCIFSM